MGSYAFILLSSFSILIAVLLGAFRMRLAERRYLPFFFFLLAGLINEIASHISVRFINNTGPNTNIYLLAVSLILVWMFYEWKVFRRKWLFQLWATVLVLLWISDTLVWGSLFVISSRFIVLFALTTVFMSVQYINQLIISEQKLTLKSPDFLICICLVVFYTAASIVEIFWFFGFQNNVNFVAKVYLIIPVVNLIVNLTYALAVLWIPRKPDFITLS